jgi:hypothetical protein
MRRHMPSRGPRKSASFSFIFDSVPGTDRMSGKLLQWNSVKRLGATVVLVGEAYDETQAYAKQRALEEGRVFVPPFDHPDVIAGQVRAQCCLRFLEPFGGGKYCPGFLRHGPTILTSSQTTSCLMTSSLPRFLIVGFLSLPCRGVGKSPRRSEAPKSPSKGCFEGGVSECGIANGLICFQECVCALSLYNIVQ